MKGFAFALLLLLLGVGCGSSSKTGFTDDDGGTTSDATVGNGGDGGGDSGQPSFTSDAAVAHDCGGTSQDMEGCTCPTPDATQACYTGDPKTRHVGNCTDGKQPCVKQGEFSSWGPCTGALTPSQES